MDKKTRTVLLSVTSNSVLLAVKLAAGIITGSASVLSEAYHSATDLVASLVAFFAVRRSDEPADESHHYGHGRIENLAGVFEGLVLLGVGIWVIYSSVRKVLTGADIEYLGLGVAVMGISAVVNVFVSGWLMRVARETDSRAIEAEAFNLRTDIWAAAGVAIGLCAALLTGWTVIDPIIAAAIGLLILRTAYKLVSGSFRVLLDESLPPEELETIRSTIQEKTEGENAIRGYHKLRARKSGANRHIDFHLQLKSRTTLGEAHKISDDLEERIRERLPNADVLIHLEDDRSLAQENS